MMRTFAQHLTVQVAFLSILLSASPSRAQALNGLWLSDGYGLLLDVQGTTINASEVTAISCIPSWQSDVSVSAGANEITFMHDSCQRRFTLDNSPDAARLDADCSSADILFRRIHEPPKGYGQPTENTAQNVYAVFWQTYAENYPFFDLHHVDWNALDKEFRPQVTGRTSPAELFRILRQMIEPLHDSHTSLNATDIKQSYRGLRPEPSPVGYNEFKKAYEIIASKYAKGQTRYFCNNKVQFAILDGSIGYLNISEFVGYTDDQDYEKQVQALDSALDAIFADAQKLKGLVIDVRFNSGGYDGLGIRIASRLTRQDYLAYQVQTRNNAIGPVHFTPAQSVRVPAGAKPGFAGNVVLLMGRSTISAGETFAMSLLGRKPSVLRIGEKTQGVFSDVLGRKLPNGWTFNLPNQVYLTEDARSFDGVGVPPDIAVPVLSDSDLQAGRDSALDKALNILSSAQP